MNQQHYFLTKELVDIASYGKMLELMKITLFVALVPRNFAFVIFANRRAVSCRLPSSKWESDFDGYVGDNNDNENDTFLLSDLFGARTNTVEDLSGCQVRQFLLGEDLVLTDFVGKQGFEEVTDWEYYYTDEDGNDRMVVQPNPLDPNQPKRTRQSSGSVVRIFRGELVGRLGNSLRSKGLDRRVLVKEYSGTMALDLAKREMTALGKLQSELVGRVSDAAKAGEWSRIASLRSVEGRKDDQYVCILVGELMKAPFLGALGEVNLAELEDEWDSNEFYRALGVPPPKAGAVWVVFEYAGLTSLQLYCQPAEFRRSRLPTKRGFLGNIVAPPPLPKWNDRARYVRHIMKQSLEAVTNLHAAGVSHRSIGRSSLIMGSKTQDKLQSSSPYAIEASQLSMKLSDFGFACLFDLAVYEKEFCQRARTFGLAVIEGKMTREVELFAQAEDLHALGLVFVGLLLTSLAEVDGPQSPIPATDEETIQRLISDIFGKDIEQFREYVQAEDVWGNMVRLLDDFEGWKLLDSLCFAREKVKEGSMVTAEKLLESPFFAKL